ncbi:hypothetical protein RND81_02G058500 [Saponaria officinalis]|uniref:Filament-like plant protein 4 n=1 Tax=Saponaria officinalis TaxID=3572 RepID=A0AAW1MK58_SAPOF
MDRRGWPWKKKASEKSAAEKAIATLDSVGGSLSSSGTQADKDNYKKPNYVQISVETYSHLTKLENQVKAYEEHAKEYEEQTNAYEEQAKAYEDQVQTMEEEINELKEKLSSTNSEITTKEELVKQHAKVAEEAVSGWEKAEAEALTLKNHLESVTLAKLAVEDRAAHLDGALKECMRQIRNLKEDNEQRLQEVAHTKNKQYDRMKHELESRIACLDQDLMRAEAENAAITRSLHERSNMLIKVSEEKARAEAEIELLKSNVESCEREINSLKYELNIVSKEMEIRNEEKNMCVKTADVANKQLLESVKKINKLEAECQRLRGLVRKKLPGPAALAQMKLEVESLGRDHGDARLRRSPMRPTSPQFSSNPHMSAVPEFSLDGVQRFQKENEFLTERLLAMEEETKMLKEALAKRNSELQASRSICAKTASKLQSLEAHVQAFNQQQGFSKAERSFSQRDSNPPSMASFSEDGNDDAASCSESWSSALISELSQIKEKNKDQILKSENGSHLELMDDFEEMEKLARDDSVSCADKSPGITMEVNGVVTNVNSTSMTSTTQPESGSLASPVADLDTNAKPLPLVKLQSRICRVFESVSNESDVMKIMEDIKHVVQEVQDDVNCHSKSYDFEEKHCSDSRTDPQNVPSVEKETCLFEDGKNGKISQDLIAAMSQIHNYVSSLGEGARAVHVISDDDDDGLRHKIEHFSATFDKLMCNESSVDDFISALSDVMAKASELSYDIFGYKVNAAEVIGPACIDKVALSENKSPQGFEPGSCIYSAEEVEQLKAEKENMEREFFRCSQDVEIAKSQLKEMEQQLTEVKSELASSQKMNGLADTQLKCMAESYKTLEKRAGELEGEVNDLRDKLESLNIQLENERTSYQEVLSRCRALEEQLQRNEECSVCSSSAAEADVKAKQEKELEAATEKLAACQETIFILGKQLKSMRPQTELMSSPNSERSSKSGPNGNGPTTMGMALRDMDQAEMDTATSPTLRRVGSEGNVPKSPASPKNQRHSPTKSVSSTGSSTPTPEKQSRGFSRFFSSKGKNDN